MCIRDSSHCGPTLAGEAPGLRAVSELSGPLFPTRLVLLAPVLSLLLAGRHRLLAALLRLYLRLLLRRLVLWLRLLLLRLLLLLRRRLALWLGLLSLIHISERPG